MHIKHKAVWFTAGNQPMCFPSSVLFSWLKKIQYYSNAALSKDGIYDVYTHKKQNKKCYSCSHCLECSVKFYILPYTSPTTTPTSHHYPNPQSLQAFLQHTKAALLAYVLGPGSVKGVAPTPRVFCWQMLAFLHLPDRISDRFRPCLTHLSLFQSELLKWVLENIFVGKGC